MHSLEVAYGARENARNLHSVMYSAAAQAGCSPAVLAALNAAAAPLLAKAEAEFQQLEKDTAA